ncbi:hypothetical protein [Erwinia sp. E602]|nr:hypothetical protein [Erwinia sp. E602]
MSELNGGEGGRVIAINYAQKLNIGSSLDIEERLQQNFRFIDDKGSQTLS